jgi:hypothetical protein
MRCGVSARKLRKRNKTLDANDKFASLVASNDNGFVEARLAA